MPYQLSSKERYETWSILSTLLFNIYTEYLMRDILHSGQGCISVEQKKINNLKYADTIVTSSQGEIIMRRIQETSGEYGLKLNLNKTTDMIAEGQNNNKLYVKYIAGFEIVNKYMSISVKSCISQLIWSKMEPRGTILLRVTNPSL